LDEKGPRLAGALMNQRNGKGATKQKDRAKGGDEDSMQCAMYEEIADGDEPPERIRRGAWNLVLKVDQTSPT
jgi:hypothetical protein